jgi:hypothetical protein
VGAIAVGKGMVLLVTGGAGHRAIARKVGVIEQASAKLDTGLSGISLRRRASIAQRHCRHD